VVTTQGMLVELLDLERIEVHIFRGRSPDENLQRVFGGQVAGQALVAAGRTVPPDRPVHSLHAYFIRPGDPDLPIVYTVDRIRDGRSFTTRRVVAVQNGRAIFALSASFQVAETGPEYQSLMPEAPDPETVPVWQERLKEYGDESPGPLAPAAPGRGPLRRRSAVAGAGSLDHAMWFHGPFRADEWLLYLRESPAASGARGLARGQVFRRDGRLLASIVQEGLIRVSSPEQ
jgi:acyl-CoA thioesterase II